jgi:NAD(P)H-hydrate epimerase
MKLVTAAEMRVLERRAVESGISLLELMRWAGRAVAEDITRVFPLTTDKSIIVLVGPGNNGGDGLVAAPHLKKAGALVSVFITGQRAADDIVYREALAAGLTPISISLDIGLERLTQALTETDFVVDAVFGTGMLRPIDGSPAAVLTAVAREKCRRPELTIVAVDLPSGLNADTGAVDPVTLKADLTITLANPKQGLFLFPGADYTGSVSVADIGIPAGLDEDLAVELLTDELVAALLPWRPADANKGAFGKVLVVAGPPEFCGAPVLACQSAYRSGAGLVTLAQRCGLHPVFAAKLTEVTHLLLPETAAGEPAPEAVELITERLGEIAALVIGPGLGKDPVTSLFFNGILSGLDHPMSPEIRPGSARLPEVVLDADALNILAVTPDWWQELQPHCVLTPHPREMSRLTGLAVELIQADRIGTACRYAELWQQIVVLKGAHSVIAAPDGRVAVSPFANPGLATAGTGDVLAGVIGGLLAQGLTAFDAARAGVYLHAAAGESVRADLGEAGMVASDLLLLIPRTIKALKENLHAAGN